MSKDYISCPWNRQDCQANENGTCIALKDADFGGCPCPFIKATIRQIKHGSMLLPAWLIKVSTMKRTAAPREDG